MTNSMTAPVSDKSASVACLLCFFLGFFGIHRFYLGKIGTGILMLLTFGGLGLWQMIDLFLLSFGEMTDGQGRRVPGSERKGLCMLLCYFLGVFGVHRFYLNKVGTGVAQLLTFGGLGIWWFVDLILLCCDELRDKDGRRLMEPPAPTLTATSTQP
jgi:TM2 domain-containing membrane protein YozV